MRRILRIALTAFTMCAITATSAFAGTWQGNGGRWKYVEDSGSCATGKWVSDQEQWYYLDSDGFMKTGWFQDADQTWYYLDASGAMVSSTTRNIDGVDYTFGASGAWLDPGTAQTNASQAANLADGWNGQTYVNHKMGYQITFPDTYIKTATETDIGLGEGAVMEFMVASTSGKMAGFGFARFDSAEIAQYDISAALFAKALQESYTSTGEVSTVTLGELEYSKLPLSASDTLCIDLYFRRTGSSMTMIESIYEPSCKAEMETVLSNLRRPQ